MMPFSKQTTAKLVWHQQLADFKSSAVSADPQLRGQVFKRDIIGK